jgi:hypothetical protein
VGKKKKKSWDSSEYLLMEKKKMPEYTIETWGGAPFVSLTYISSNTSVPMQQPDRFPGFGGEAFFNNDNGRHPCCPSGCDPCGLTYYQAGKHNECCCVGSCCASRELLQATATWLGKWLEAENEWKTVQWLEAEYEHNLDVEAWVRAEEAFAETLVPKKPLVVRKPRPENSPAKVKHLNALKQQAS